MDDLAKRMTDYRAKYGLSQDKLAKRCGVTLQTIYFIETGKTHPTRLTRAKIERIINEK